MSELTAKVCAAMKDGTIIHRYPSITALCDEHERMEAEHKRICTEHAILVNELSTQGRELQRIKGLLRAWGANSDEKGNTLPCCFDAKMALHGIAVKLAKEET